MARTKDKIERFQFVDQVVRELTAQGFTAASSKDVIKTVSFKNQVIEGHR